MCNKKRKLLFILMLMIFYLFCNLIYAQQVQKDVEVGVIVPSITNATNYTKFIRVTNNDDVIGENDNLSVFVRMTLFHEDNFENEMLKWNSTKTINSYSEAGFGVLSIENGTYTFCAYLQALNFIDTKPENNAVCTNISTKDIAVNTNNTFNTSDITNSTNVENATNMTNFNISDNNLSDDNISNNNISDSNITEANITNSNISYVNLSDSNITEANITEINMTNGNISYNNSLEITNSTDIISNSSIVNETNLGNSSNTSIEINIDCSCKLQILTNKEIFNDGERIEFQILDCENNSKYTSPIEYWAEDSIDIVKPLLNTTSKTTKTYTPNIDISEKYFLIKSRIQGCNETFSKLVVFTKNISQIDEEETLTETSLVLTSPGEVSISSEYEIIYATIEGYKGDSSKTLISVWAECSGDTISDTTKLYVNKKNSYFDFKIPILLHAGDLRQCSVIADGLGEHNENEIIMFDDREDTNVKEPQNKATQKSSDANTQSISKNNSRGKIISFYTRKKLFDNNITIYISIDKPENKTLIISGDNETLILRNLSEKNEINISIISETETITAKLYLGNELLDYAELKLNLTSNMKEENASSQKMQAKSGEISIGGKNISELYFYGLSNTTILNNASANVSKSFENKITGEIVAVPLKKGSIIFAVVAVIICFVLFNKKSRAVIFKKTKIFK